MWPFDKPKPPEEEAPGFGPAILRAGIDIEAITKSRRIQERSNTRLMLATRAPFTVEDAKEFLHKPGAELWQGGTMENVTEALATLSLDWAEELLRENDRRTLNERRAAGLDRPKPPQPTENI